MALKFEEKDPLMSPFFLPPRFVLLLALFGLMVSGFLIARDATDKTARNDPVRPLNYIVQQVNMRTTIVSACDRVRRVCMLCNDALARTRRALQTMTWLSRSACMEADRQSQGLSVLRTLYVRSALPSNFILHSNSRSRIGCHCCWMEPCGT